MQAHIFAQTGADFCHRWAYGRENVSSGNASAVCALIVIFQEVVHSSRIGETGIIKLIIQRRVRMNIHKNARLTPLRREEMALSVIAGHVSKVQAARMHAVSTKIVTRWVERFKAQGRAGMVDRSSRPRRMPSMTDPAIARHIVALRRKRWTGRHIACELGVSPATVSRVLKRAGLSKLKDIAPAEPVRRYQREHQGEMIHIDIKKLGRFNSVGHRIAGDPRKGKSRGAGWEFVHVAIDDASRIAFSQILPDESKHIGSCG